MILKYQISIDKTHNIYILFTLFIQISPEVSMNRAFFCNTATCNPYKWCSTKSFPIGIRAVLHTPKLQYCKIQGIWKTKVLALLISYDGFSALAICFPWLDGSNEATMSFTRRRHKLTIVKNIYTKRIRCNMSRTGE